MCALTGIAVPFSNYIFAIEKEATNLIIRADDMGMSHGTNLACIDTYQKGVVKSVEVMVPTPWFPEAVDLCNQNPELDVGIHLSITSDWQTIRWRPLIHSKSLTDADGYFYLRKSGNSFDNSQVLSANQWDIGELEKELRAQIELALKKIPHITHFSEHVFFSSISAKVKELLIRLSDEYKLFYEGRENVKFVNKYKKYDQKTLTGQKSNYIQSIKNLTPGNWIMITHPIADTPESHAIKRENNQDMAEGRILQKQILIDAQIKEVIEEQNINLISYADLLK